MLPSLGFPIQKVMLNETLAVVVLVVVLLRISGVIICMFSTSNSGDDGNVVNMVILSHAIVRFMIAKTTWISDFPIDFKDELCN